MRETNRVKNELHVLILEDVPSDVVLINHELRKSGLTFNSTRVEDRESFERELKQHPPDLILSDHGLAEFDGFTALTIAHEQCPEVPFIFVTGTLGEEMAIQTFEKGATDYVLKQRLSTNLVPAVQRALRVSEERTRRKQAEEELRESEARFRMLVEGVKDYAIFMLDTNGNIATWNSGAETIEGYQPEEILGQHFSWFYPRADITAGKPAQALNVALKDGRFEEEGWRVRKNSSQFWAHVTISALRDDAGHLRGFAHVTRDITERKQSESALQKSEERKAAILDTALDAIVSMDGKGKIQEWNPAAEKMFGYSRKQAMGQDMADMIIPTILQESHRRGLEHFLNTGDGPILGHRVELAAKRVDGTIFPVEVSINPIPNTDPPMFTGFIRDISERKENLEALKKSESRKAAILDTAMDAIITMDHEGIVREWNHSAESIFGYSREVALGAHLDQLIIPPALRATYRNSLAEYLMTGASTLLGRPIDITVMRADGSEFQAELAITRSSAENTPLYTSFIRDITERKKSVEALRKSERQYRMLVDNVEDYAIYLLDPQGHVATWNAGAERIEGYKDDEILGQHFSRFYPEEYIRAGKPEKVLALATAEGQYKEEDWRVRKDGSRYFASVLVTALRNEAGELYGYSKFHRDITKRKEAEDEINRLNADLENRVIERTAQLEAANKELEAFSYSVSHDLRAPLRHINGFVEMLQSQAEEHLTEDDRRLIQTISDSARQMGNLIDDLLEFSRMGRVEMHKVPINLDNLVKAAINDLRHDAEGRSIEWNVQPLQEVWGDPGMLRHALVNLLANALKYTRRRDKARIEIGSRTDGNEVVFYVRDNGVGFDMKYVDKLFGVFQRLHRASDFEGTGIGLANVRRIIARHGGRTWAEAKVNEGATFFFSLPTNKGGNDGQDKNNPAGG